MKKTHQEIVAFLNASHSYIERHPKESKFKYALTRTEKSLKNLYEEYAEKIADLNIEHCVADDKGVILKDERGEFQFTKESLRLRNKAQKAVLMEAVAVKGYTAQEIPDDLTDDEREIFAGFVLPEEAGAPDASALAA